MALDQRAGYSERPGTLISVPVAPGERIFDGAIVAIEGTGSNDGRAQNWSDATGSNDRLAGIARVTQQTGVETEEGESIVGDTPGNTEVEIDTSGPILKQVTITGSTQFSVGDLVYASDENTFQVAPTGGGQSIGWITRFHGNEVCDFQLFPTGTWRAAVAL